VARIGSGNLNPVFTGRGANVAMFSDCLICDLLGQRERPRHIGRGRYWSMVRFPYLDLNAPDSRVLAKPDFGACVMDTRETAHKSLLDAERFPRKQCEEKVQIEAVCEGSKTIAQLRPKFLKKRSTPPTRQGWLGLIFWG